MEAMPESFLAILSQIPDEARCWLPSHVSNFRTEPNDMIGSPCFVSTMVDETSRHHVDNVAEASDTRSNFGFCVPLIRPSALIGAFCRSVAILPEPAPGPRVRRR